MILAWPPDEGHSLVLKGAHWAVDPTGSLPVMPNALPMRLDDDGDAVAAHDAQEAEYYRRRAASTITRWRLNVRTASDPIDPSTERQLLVGLAILSALGVWRINER